MIENDAFLKKRKEAANIGTANGYPSLPLDEGGKCARIDLSALRRNFGALRAFVRAKSADTRVICVVKADAYGHGATACVQALLAAGCDFFAVSCIEEALTVRRALRGVSARADVLILGYTDPALAETLVREDCIQALVSPAYAEALANAAARAGVRVRCHAAIDTGMNRIGFDARTDEEIARTVRDLRVLSANAALSVEGAFTHLATADEDSSTGRERLSLQLARYRALRAQLDGAGVQIPFHHACNSAATLLGSAPLFDGVRLGVSLYGAAPALHAGLDLRPVMRLQAPVIHVHALPAGEPLGYGATYAADTDRTVAVLPLGYADGFLRAYSGATLTLQTRTGTHRVPVIGRVCMDQCMLDVTGTDAAVGDTVTVFGDTPDALAALSRHAGTIDYECLCVISPRVRRVYENG